MDYIEGTSVNHSSNGVDKTLDAFLPRPSERGGWFEPSNQSTSRESSFPTAARMYIQELTLLGIAKQASQLTMYDIKSYYNTAKNAVLNVSEMEAKVREATNDDAW